MSLTFDFWRNAPTKIKRILTIVAFFLLSVIITVAGALTPLSLKEASEIEKELEEMRGNINIQLVFGNNFMICLAMFLPVAGPIFGSYVLYSTGVVIAAESVALAHNQTTIYASKDIYIDENHPDTIMDNKSGLYVGRSTTDRAERALLHFSMSGLPTDAIITQAKLKLYLSYSDSNSETIWAYRLTQTEWDESSVTWNNYTTNQAWNNPGGDYTTTNETSSSVGTTMGQWYEWDVKTIAVYAFNNLEKQVHLLLKYKNENETGSKNIKVFNSIDQAPNKPKLEVTYYTENALKNRIPPIIIFLFLFAFPFTWLEFLAYSAAFAESIWLTWRIIQHKSKRELVNTCIFISICAVMLLIAAIIEIAIISYFGGFE
jgi:hypothetical protein